MVSESGWAFDYEREAPHKVLVVRLILNLLADATGKRSVVAGQCDAGFLRSGRRLVGCQSSR